MSLKINLTMLMMLVGLLAFGQYPTTKKINGVDVVIMTVDQANAINNRFQVLEDSIENLNNSLNGCETSLNFTQNKVEVLTDSINAANDTIAKMNTMYLTEIKRIDKLEFIDKRTRVRLNTGIALVLFTWIYGIISSK